MATQKQVQAVRKLAGIVGRKFNYAIIEGLDNGELDRVFDELRLELKTQSVKKDHERSRLDPDFNPYRFGMCFKLVCDNLTLPVVFDAEEKFKQQVEKLYDLATSTVNRISRQHLRIETGHHADY